MMAKKNWRIKFLTSGVLTFTSLGNAKKGIDVFLVGGGGGNGNSNNISDWCAAGGGGYTKTVKSLIVQKDVEYQIVMGAGGTRPITSNTQTRGGTTSAFNASIEGGYSGKSISGGDGGSGGASTNGTTGGTADTLPPYVPKGYAVELAECMRYAIVLPNQMRIRAATISNNTLEVFVPLPMLMRSGGFPSLQGADFAVVTMTGDVQSGFAFSVISIGTNGFTMRATKTSHGLSDADIRTTASTVVSRDL